jgi:hypothetical protein
VGDLIGGNASVSAMIQAGDVVNANVDPAMEGTNHDYPFVIDGESYRVVSHAYPFLLSSQATCDPSVPMDGALQATRVTVTVTWLSQKEMTAPHTASKIFAPKASGGGSTSQPDQAYLLVRVAGQPGPDGLTARKDVKVTVQGGNYNQVFTTNDVGCAAVPVFPSLTGTEYTVTLTKTGYMTPNGPTPTEQRIVMPGATEVFPFNEFDQAARLDVKIENWNESIWTATLDPSSGGLVLRDAEVDELTQTAKFEMVYPGTYSLKAGTSVPKSITLSPGESRSETVVIP